MFGAVGSPLSEKSMLGVLEATPAANGDESGIAHRGEDHGFINLTSSALKHGHSIPFPGIGRQSNRQHALRLYPILP